MDEDIQSKDMIPLFKYFPKLSVIPRIPLIENFTPIQKLENVSLKMENNVYVKRDDICNAEYGGNKPRKYEFILPYIVNKQKKVIVTLGGVGVGITMFAKKYGIETEFYCLDQKPLPVCVNNLKLMKYFGAKLHYSKTIFKTVTGVLFKVLLNIRTHCFLEPGGSSVLGMLGYVNAGLELISQIESGDVPIFDKIFVTIGSSGTVVGLYIGVELGISKLNDERKLKYKDRFGIIGTTVLKKKLIPDRTIYKLCRKTINFLQKYYKDIPNLYENLFKEGCRLEVERNFVGIGYGIETKEGVDAKELAKKDMLKLDLVYTSKCFSSLISYCQKRKKKEKVENLLFINTKNSKDFSDIYSKIDYKDLPKSFHCIFEEEKSKKFLYVHFLSLIFLVIILILILINIL